ncbi:MAG: mitochondrial inner membrane protein required for protein import [Icmadophila ericetorum]|nr:mitochondrial inner membrane protein required for protein import [Icmadophila ericetorum]
MLARAAVRSLRPHAPPLRATTSLLQIRNFAKNNKSIKKPYDYKIPAESSLNRHGPSGQILEQAGAFTSGGAATKGQESSNKSGNSDISKLQEEFINKSRGEEDMKASTNNEFSSSSLPSEDVESKKAPEYSKLQDEFQTSSPDQNTAPQDTSPSAIDPVEVRRQEMEPSLASKQGDGTPVSPKQQADSAVPPLHDLTKGIPSTLDAELSNASKSESSPPLHDLTKGIPSTLDAELEATNAKLQPADLGISEGAAKPAAGGRGRGQLPASAYITSAERRRNRMMSWVLSTMALFCLTGPIYLGRNWETEEEEKKHPDVPSGWGLMLFYNRAKARVGEMLDYYNEPTFPTLLPDADPTWNTPPYTLVLSLEDLLVHNEWSREHGWRLAKRPGVDYFLRYLSQYYELVLFTSVPSVIADPVLRKLDPYRIVVWPLFREATRYKNGEYIKDLSYLNRPLSRTILIDTVPAHASLQPENAIILEKWLGDPQDKDLVALIPFLEYVAAMSFDDVRTVLKSFEGKHIPTEFAAREAIAREKFEAQLAAERAKRPKHSGIGMLGSALGLNKGMGTGGMMLDGAETTLAEGFEQGKMLSDQIRERGQRQYEIVEREIRENGEKWLKDMAAEEKKLQEESIKGMKGSVTAWIPGFSLGGGNKDSSELSAAK